MNAPHTLLVNHPEFVACVAANFKTATRVECQEMFNSLQTLCPLNTRQFYAEYGENLEYFELITPGLMRCVTVNDRRNVSHPHIGVFLYMLHRMNVDPERRSRRRTLLPTTVDLNYTLTRHERHDSSCFFMTIINGLKLRNMPVSQSIENHLSLRMRVCEQLFARRDRCVRPVLNGEPVCRRTWLDMFCETTFEGMAVAASSVQLRQQTYDSYVQRDLTSPYTSTTALSWHMTAVLLNEMRLNVRLVIMHEGLGVDQREDLVFGEGDVDLLMCLWDENFYGFVHNSDVFRSRLR